MKIDINSISQLRYLIRLENASSYHELFGASENGNYVAVGFGNVDYRNINIRLYRNQTRSQFLIATLVAQFIGAILVQYIFMG